LYHSSTLFSLISCTGIFGVGTMSIESGMCIARGSSVQKKVNASLVIFS